MLHPQKPIFKYSLLVILLSISSWAFGQDRWLDLQASDPSKVASIELPALDNASLRIKYDLNKADGPAPRKFAEPIRTFINTIENGTWESSDKGYVLWRQRIISKGAYSINLGFESFHLPPSAALFISDAKREVVIGPITQEDNDVHGEWWSPVIPSDDIIVELQIDEKDLPDLKLDITSVNHDFSGFGAVLAGSCNVDVLCGEEDGFAIIDRFRDLINSVGMVMVRGSLQCTGVLVNNTNQDCTPYVLTAEHCGITNSSAASVVVYWNFQNSFCREPGSQASGQQGNGRQQEFNSGASLISKLDQSDFTLIRLDENVNPDFNPFFVGWDRETEMVDTSLTIHHPSGGNKRISFDFDPLTFNIDRNFVRVSDWDIGTTEGGSSGSPLFNTDMRMIGHLSGGDAACGLDEYDDFGMFKKAWDGGGTPSTRLSDWLDPNNTGQTTLDGRYCVDVAVLEKTSSNLCRANPFDTIALNAITGYSDSGTLSVISAPRGVNVSFSDNTISTNEVVDIFLEISNEFQAGTNSIQLLLENDLGPTSFTIDLNVYDGLPSQPNLAGPVDGTEGLDFEVNFAWSGNAASYTLEISELPSFESGNRIINDLSETQITLKDFPANSNFYWRVKSHNACGFSNYSTVFNFSTGNIVCQSFKPSDLPKEITLQPITITSVIPVSVSGTISDVNVLDIQGKHTWIEDLTMTLTSPSGTTVVLVETPCSREDDFFVSFDDESENINLDCPLTTRRAFKPVEALSAFLGEEAAGDWTLSVIDGVNDDGGSLDDWTLELCVNQSDNKRFDLSSNAIEICDKNPGDITFSLSYRGNWVNPNIPVISTGSGTVLSTSITTDPNAPSKIDITFNNPELLIGVTKLNVSVSDDSDMVMVTIPVTHINDVAAPSLELPLNGSEKIDLKPEFSWTSGHSGTGPHRVVVSFDEAFTSIVIDTIVSGNGFASNITLDELTEFFWSVEALGNCIDLSSEVNSFTTDIGTSTRDPELEGFFMYPSPANNVINVSIPESIKQRSLRLEVYAIDGRRIFTQEVNQWPHQIEVSTLESGLYFVNLISEKGNFAKKVVVQRK